MTSLLSLVLVFHGLYSSVSRHIFAMHVTSLRVVCHISACRVSHLCGSLLCVCHISACRVSDLSVSYSICHIFICLSHLQLSCVTPSQCVSHFGISCVTSSHVVCHIFTMCVTLWPVVCHIFTRRVSLLPVCSLPLSSCRSVFYLRLG